jgi:hypothetical protein
MMIALDQAQIVFGHSAIRAWHIRCEPPQPMPLNPACWRKQAQSCPWGELSYVPEKTGYFCV